MSFIFTQAQLDELQLIWNGVIAAGSDAVGAYVPVHEYIVRTVLGLPSTATTAEIWLSISQVTDPGGFNFEVQRDLG